MSRGRALLAWVAVALLCWPWSGAAPRSEGAPLAVRLLGPVASLAASFEWIRFRTALRDGDEERAYAAAERALELDPRDTRGWIVLAHHYLFDRGSPSSEPDPERRVAWARAGLAVLARGEARAADPGELAAVQGTTRAGWLAELDPEDLPWPGGRAALLDAARADFARAEAAGHPFAAELAAALDD